MNYDAVLFDLDGTLTDSADGIMGCVCFALEQMGLPQPEEAVLRKFMGPPLVASFQRYLHMTEAQAIEATEHYRIRYQDIGWRENRVYHGIRRLLRCLKQQGVYLAVATGKPQQESLKILEHFRLLPFFDAVAGPDHKDYHANKRDLILRALQGFKGRTVMVGDRDSDIIASHELQIDSIAVLYGYGSTEEMEACRPGRIASTTAELYGMLCPERAEPEQGFFISVEGNDGCGKSTQVELLHQRLRDCGYDVYRTREPGGSDVAEKIRQLLLDPENSSMHDMTEALLYAAARAQHVRDVIRPQLAAGKLVLSDRYVDSSIAYQGGGRELGLELVKQINAPAIDGCLPDLTIFLDIDAAEALRRRVAASGMDRIEMEDGRFHARVAAAYQQLLEENSKRIKPVDASGSAQEVALRVEQAVFKRLLKQEGI